MITPYLEKLILQGKASYNTFVVGGSQKTILNVTNNRYIIITDITVFHHLDLPDAGGLGPEFGEWIIKHMITQLAVFSDRAYNHFLIRNDVDWQEAGRYYVAIPKGSTKFDTYLVHNTDVAFSWTKSTDMKTNYGDTPAGAVARPLPFDYGKIGQNYQNVILTNELGVAFPQPYLINQMGTAYPLPNQVNSNQLFFPVSSQTTLENFEFSFQYPVANIGYVEIFGELDNIQPSL